MMGKIRLQLIHLYMALENRKNVRYLHSRKAKIGKNPKLYGKLFIRGGQSIRIGDDFRMHGSNRYNPLGFREGVNLVASGGSITIGNHSGMSNTTIRSCASVTIGDRVLLGGGVKIYDSDFHSLDAQYRGTSQDDAHTVSKPIIIEDDVFVGAGTIILKGVHIGKASIVGAGSVVTKSIPEKEIWGGNPAKFLRYVDNSKHDKYDR